MTLWHRLLRRRALERELDAELRDHIEREVADGVRAGQSEADVRRQMRLTSGGLDQIKEACRDVRRPRALADVGADLRFAWRVLAKDRWFTAGAVLLTPAVLWTEAPLRQLTLGWPWLLYLGGVATAGAYAVYSLGLRRVPASVAGVVTLVEPLTATLLGVVLFGERLGATGVVGAVLLFSALGLVLTPHAVSRDA